MVESLLDLLLHCALFSTVRRSCARDWAPLASRPLQEKGNLSGKHSFRSSGLVNKKVLHIEAATNAETGKDEGVVLSIKKQGVANKPSSECSPPHPPPSLASPPSTVRALRDGGEHSVPASPNAPLQFLRLPEHPAHLFPLLQPMQLGYAVGRQPGALTAVPQAPLCPPGSPAARGGR